MKNTQSADILIGKVVGYQSGLFMLSNKAYMHVSSEGYRLAVKFDPRQIKFIEEEYPRGSDVPLEFYGGEWHIYSKPAAQDISAYDTDVSALEMLNRIASG